MAVTVLGRARIDFVVVIVAVVIVLDPVGRAVAAQHGGVGAVAVTVVIEVVDVAVYRVFVGVAVAVVVGVVAVLFCTREDRIEPVIAVSAGGDIPQRRIALGDDVVRIAIAVAVQVAEPVEGIDGVLIGDAVAVIVLVVASFWGARVGVAALGVAVRGGGDVPTGAITGRHHSLRVPEAIPVAVVVEGVAVDRLVVDFVVTVVVLVVAQLGRAREGLAASIVAVGVGGDRAGGRIAGHDGVTRTPAVAICIHVEGRHDVLVDGPVTVVVQAIAGFG